MYENIMKNDFSVTKQLCLYWFVYTIHINAFNKANGNIQLKSTFVDRLVPDCFTLQ